MKKLSEMSKQEVEEIANKQFVAVPVKGIKNYEYAIPASPEFLKVTNIWHEALEIYLREHFEK